MNEERLRKLAGIRESGEPMDDDEADRMRDAEDAARNAREKKITRMVAYAFKRAGLDVERINYDEENDRTCWVVLDDYEVKLSQLAALMQSGLAQDFTVSASHSRGIAGLDVEFTVAPELDQAEVQ